MKKILIANRGEIARRVIATAHRLGLRHRGRAFRRRRRRALHVREADRGLCAGWRHLGRQLSARRQAAGRGRATGADAIHPGYGFLSEDADVCACRAGRRPELDRPAAGGHRRAWAARSAAKALAGRRRALPAGLRGRRPVGRALRRRGRRRIGYPVMVKAVAGGGGRGMRLVTERRRRCRPPWPARARRRWPASATATC
jgi:geranyl-CoA carboxylase alpha subunit